MTADYTPQVGDQVRRPNWSEGKMITVTAVGKECLLAIGNFPDGVEWEASFRINGGWVKVEPPPTYPERWLNVYPLAISGRNHATKQEADDYALANSIDDVPGYARIAVIHLAKDGTLTLHPTTGGAS